MMRWEWRIFYENLQLQPWNPRNVQSAELVMALNNAPLDNRVDYYLNLDDPTCGLKERWSETSPKLELKVLQLRSRLSDHRWFLGEFEEWERCMSTEITEESVDATTGLAPDLVVKYLKEEKWSLGRPRSNKSTDAILRIINSIQQGAEIARMKLDKARKQCRAVSDRSQFSWKFSTEKMKGPNAILIEQAEIALQIKNKSQKLLTVCVEGDSIETMARFIEHFLVITDGLIMGYPKFIMERYARSKGAGFPGPQ
jgi:hypothetical protein